MWVSSTTARAQRLGCRYEVGLPRRRRTGLPHARTVSTQLPLAPRGVLSSGGAHLAVRAAPPSGRAAGCYVPARTGVTAPCCVPAPRSAVEALYADLPGGYDVDKEAALYNDSLTYGEMATSDLALLVQRVPEHASLNFTDLGSGIGKLVLAAAAVFNSSTGIELAPERAAVASAALAKLGAQAPRNCKLVCGDFLVPPLCAFHVVFTHNMVFTRALQRAMQLKMDRELPAGAVVFAVFALQYTKRGKLTAELAATYGWAADGEPRPLYEYRFEGLPLSPASSEDGSP